MYKISIILCTLNEESHIEKTIKKIFKVYPKAEIVIVDDNSTDKTVKIIKKLQLKNINLIQRHRARGLASAFVVGMFNAKGVYIGWIDSNMSYVMDKFKNMEKLLDNGYDLVLLSRYVKGGSDQRSFTRVLFSKVFNNFCQLFLSNKIKDFSSGIFLLKRDILKEIVPLGYGHGEFFVEFILKIYLTSFKIKEIPYVQKDNDPNGKSKTFPSLYYFFKLSLIYFIRVVTISFRK